MNLDANSARSDRRSRRRFAVLGCSAVLLLSSAGAAADLTTWRAWGGSPSQDRYSPAAQITTANVAQLKPVWAYMPKPTAGTWQVTPLVVDGLMYLNDPDGAVVALEPETGKVLWRFAVQDVLGADYFAGSTRGVSYWPGEKGYAPRIIYAQRDRIYALDAKTGAQVQDFGAKGYIDLREGVAEAFPEGRLAVTSPPAVYKNLLIVGPSTQEFGSKGPAGDPRAFDMRTGKLVWRFNTVPRPGQPHSEGWGPDGWKDRAGPSAWGAMSIDEQRGMVFIPVGNPADSYIGVDRPGDNLYANSVLALDAATGKYRWHFQTVRHDLFDYDVAAPPALIDLRVKGKATPVVVQATKAGLLFILDRTTGRPVFGIEERPVPRSEVPGEQAAATQPFPVKPPPLARLGMKRSDITTITEEAHRVCTDKWNREGFSDTEAFTPPRLNGPTLFLPANYGGAGGVFGGVSFDPALGYIFVNTNNFPSYSRLVPDGKGGYRTEGAYSQLTDHNGFPCVQPPWGELIAVNGATGDIAWRRPLGSAEVYGELGRHTGTISMGASVATAGGLVFIGATMLDPHFRAFEARTGQELWSARLNSAAVASPMSFVGRDGRQYVVIASGRTPAMEKRLVAFALPKPGEVAVDLNPAPIPRPTIVAAGAPPPPAILPDGAGREDVLAMCSPCHGLPTVTAKRRSVGQWEGMIADMRRRGAKGDDAMAIRVRDYLTTHYGTGH